MGDVSVRKGGYGRGVTEKFTDRLPLSRTGLDRACEQRADAEFLPTLLTDPATRVLWLHGGNAPVRHGALQFAGADSLQYDDAAQEGAEPRLVVYLGRTAQSHVVLAVARPDESVERLGEFIAGGGPVPAGESLQWLGLRDVSATLSPVDSGTFVEAVAIANWHEKHAFCPRCGAKTVVTQSGWVRECTQDQSQHFPRTDPAVIVAITDHEDRILLGANAAWGGTRFSVLAGFVEPGESLEAAVVREIHEEAGVWVTDVTYKGSQPWPFPASLMLGFTAKATSQEVKADGEEILSVKWFSREELALAVEEGGMGIPSSVSIARALIDDWYGGPVPEPKVLEN